MVAGAGSSTKHALASRPEPSCCCVHIDTQSTASIRMSHSVRLRTTSTPCSYVCLCSHGQRPEPRNQIHPGGTMSVTTAPFFSTSVGSITQSLSRTPNEKLIHFIIISSYYKQTREEARSRSCVPPPPTSSESCMWHRLIRASTTRLTPSKCQLVGQACGGRHAYKTNSSHHTHITNRLRARETHSHTPISGSASSRLRARKTLARTLDTH